MPLEEGAHPPDRETTGRARRRIVRPQYSRGHIYRRVGSYTNMLITSLGPIKFRVERVIRRTDGRVHSPILEELDVKPRKYSRDVRRKCVEFASKMSYGDASIEF